MKILKGLAWMAIVLTPAANAGAQATVGDEPIPPREQPTNNAIVSAARDRRSINITSDRAPGGAGGIVPEFHTVERGDTLWDITGYYFGNPWRWPQVWGLNPQITNPHWIFPSDQVRLMPPDNRPAAVRPTAQNAQTFQQRFTPRNQPGTVFFNDEGWLDRQEGDQAGTIVGSPEDQMLLAEGDLAYAEFPRRTPRVGETFTIYQEGQDTRGGDRNAGRVVRIVGTAVVESWDRNRNVATVRITESLDSIERGERLAAIPRRLQVVPPVRNASEVRAQIVATTQPRTLVGQNMAVFINRGENDGVRVGNRFFVVRRGDAWRQSLTVSEGRVNQTGIDRDGDGHVDPPRATGRGDSTLPEEIVGEVLVVETRQRTATAIVTSSVVDLQVGDNLEMRRGY